MNNSDIIIKDYGIMILKKDSILYHTSNINLVGVNNINKYFLFCSFHPFDYEGNSNYINRIRLKKDIKLFFMVSHLKINKSNKRIHSSFSNFFDKEKKNLSTSINKNKIIKFKNKLKNIKLDGWFSSIEDKIGIEIALLNNKELYECINANNFNPNWNFVYGENNNNSYIDLGTKYKICTIEKPAILIINEKFRQNIEKVKKRFLEKNFLLTTVIEVVLQNAIILYFDENNQIQNIDNIINKYIK